MICTDRCHRLEKAEAWPRGEDETGWCRWLYKSMLDQGRDVAIAHTKHVQGPRLLDRAGGDSRAGGAGGGECACEQGRAQEKGMHTWCLWRAGVTDTDRAESHTLQKN